MHEYALARDLINRAVLEAARQGSNQVVRLTIAMGEERHLDPEVLRFNLEAAARGTAVAGAEFQLVPGAGRGVMLESLELEGE